ncbi:hypothetical protein MSKU3_0011 [Komagataeibacter oboediens]|nr:hypothetical protein MSKU3_0011 [Komagataeibacter oboediens]
MEQAWAGGARWRRTRVIRGMWQGYVAAGQIKIACAPFPSRRFGVYLRMAGRVVLPCV